MLLMHVTVWQSVLLPGHCVGDAQPLLLEDDELLLEDEDELLDAELLLLEEDALLLDELLVTLVVEASTLLLELARAPPAPPALEEDATLAPPTLEDDTEGAPPALELEIDPPAPPPLLEDAIGEAEELLTMALDKLELDGAPPLPTRSGPYTEHDVATATTPVTIKTKRIAEDAS